jgi:hypothetical protein
MTLSQSKVMKADVPRAMAANRRGDSVGFAQIGDHHRRKRIFVIDGRRKIRQRKTGIRKELSAWLRERIKHDAVPLGQRSSQPQAAHNVSVAEPRTGIDNDSDFGGSS